MTLTKFFSIVILFGLSLRLSAYNEIVELNKNDNNFNLLSEKTSSEELSFFEYKLKENETLLSISQITKTSISAILTVNRSNHQNQFSQGDYILIPSSKGIFLAVDPQNDLEFLLNERLYKELRFQNVTIVSSAKNKKSNTFYFLNKKVLTKSEYNLWKHLDYRTPVLKGYITSYFGPRISPISGYKIFHNGLDIASKSGTHIFASKSGVIVRDGFNPVFGYFFVILHEDGYETLYGHLLDGTVTLGNKVYIGQHIGYMGSTGSSTGPHIHFEIHNPNSEPVNPLPFLTLKY